MMSEAAAPNVTVNTRSSCSGSDIKASCLFCDCGSEEGNKLINAATKDIGVNIHCQAVEMQNTKLLNKIISTDFVAQEIKYHHECFTKFRNNYHSHQRAATNRKLDPYRLTYGSVISELIQHMQEMFLYSVTVPVFRLADLTKMVAKRMTSLGVPTDDSNIHRTRLKEQLLKLIPGLREDKSSREVILTFEADMTDAIYEACEYNDLTDGMCVARAATILRRDMFNDFPKFTGSFSNDFTPRDCVPPSLVNFLSTLVGGCNIDNGSPAASNERTAALTLAQLIRLNSVKRMRPDRPEQTRHHISHETPLPVYIGLMVHNCTRNKTIVEKLNHHGLSVSYSRVLEIECTTTNAVCDLYRSLGDVIPKSLHPNVCSY